MEPYIIKINTPSEINSDTIITNLFTSYANKIYDPELYKNGDDDGNLNIYSQIYKDIINKNIPMDKKLVYFSSDSAITSSVITGLSERYMFASNKNGNQTYDSNLKILYVNSTYDLNTDNNYNTDGKDNNKDDDDDITILKDFEYYNKSIISNALALLNNTYTKHNLNINSKNIYFIGQNDSLNTNSENINKKGYTTQTKIINLGPNPINSYSLDSNKDNIISKYSYNIF
jgi:hypothetical protein